MQIPLDHIDDGLVLTIEPLQDRYTCEIRADAIENGESRYQLGEGQFYDYEFSKEKFGFAKSEPIEYFRRQKHIGRISPNIYVGTLSLEVIHSNSNGPVGKVEIEVQSKKADYRNDYRRMLEEITEHCFDLILQLNVPIKQNVVVDFAKDASTDYQRFAFVKSVIDSENFNEAILRIVSSPVTTWSEEDHSSDLRRIRRIGRGIAKQITSRNNRLKLPDEHHLRKYGLADVPRRVQTKSKQDSVDAPENRFVKHALEAFHQFILDFNGSVSPNSREAKESKALSEKVQGYLNHGVFRSVARATFLKLNSPVLQRKEGYREVFRAWIMFDLAARLVWSGGDDVYSAGKKDIATLYEYWLFFKLLKLFEEIFNLESTELEKLIIPTKDNLGLQLKQGSHIALQGTHASLNRKLNIRFSYNRSFPGSKNYPVQGSWTKTMRPDYSLSIWPGNIKEKEAEELELITHVHFDAKYRIENFLDNVKESDLSVEKLQEAKGVFKNADLIKMHAYRDAIRRTAGAYILYPGTEVYRREGFHEIIPGLGAFPIKPSVNDSGILALKSFVLEVVENLTNRASQKEQHDSNTYHVHKFKPSNSLHEFLPENDSKNRDLHPLETTVLIGYYKDVEHLHWIEKELIYNTRINSNRGSLKIDSGLASARYLLLHGRDELKTNRLFEIQSGGTRIFTKEELIKHNYPGSPSQDAYLVFEIKNVDLTEFGNPIWDIRQLKNHKSTRDSALPFTETLHSLMRAVIR